MGSKKPSASAPGHWFQLLAALAVPDHRPRGARLVVGHADPAEAGTKDGALTSGFAMGAYGSPKDGSLGG